MKREYEKEEVNKGLKLLIKSSIIVFIAIILSKIFNYLYRIIIARYFGPEVYGLFSISLVIVGWFVAFSLLGFDEGIIRYLSFYRGRNEQNKIRYLFRFSSRILFFSLLIASGVLFSFSDFISNIIFHNSDLSYILKMYSLIIPFWGFYLYFLSIIRSFEKIKQLSLIDNILNYFFKLILIILFLVIGLETNAVFFSFFLGTILISISAFFYCKFKIPNLFGAL
ncbi:MAG: oligosaccharide flippase family protein [Nanoarchaeota archaeon]